PALREGPRRVASAGGGRRPLRLLARADGSLLRLLRGGRGGGGGARDQRPRARRQTRRRHARGAALGALRALRGLRALALRVGLRAGRADAGVSLAQAWLHQGDAPG